MSTMMHNEEKTVQDAMGHVYEREDVVHERMLADRDGNSYEDWRAGNVTQVHGFAMALP